MTRSPAPAGALVHVRPGGPRQNRHLSYSISTLLQNTQDVVESKLKYRDAILSSTRTTTLPKDFSPLETHVLEFAEVSRMMGTAARAIAATTSGNSLARRERAMAIPSFPNAAACAGPHG